MPKRGPLIAGLRDFYPVYLACGSGADITRSLAMSALCHKQTYAVQHIALKSITQFIAAKVSTTLRLLTLIMPMPG